MTGVLQHLLVAIDGSARGERVVSFAIAVARRHGSHLLICHVADHTGTVAEETASSDTFGLNLRAHMPDNAAASILAQAAERATAAGLLVSTKLLSGRPAHAIVECAKERHVDAIFMGTHSKSGLERVFLGSTTDGVLRNTEVPTFVLPPGTRDANCSFDRILVAVDDSDPSDAAVDFALNLAEVDEAQLVLCSVVVTTDILKNAVAHGLDPILMIEEARATAAALLSTRVSRGTKTTTCECVVAEDDPTEKILMTAEERHAGLIVVGDAWAPRFAPIVFWKRC